MEIRIFSACFFLVIVCIKLFPFINNLNHSIKFMLSSRHIKPTLSLPNNNTITALRSKLKEQSRPTEETDCIVEGSNASLDAHARMINSSESLIKNILHNLKQAHSQSAQWLAQSSKVRPKQGAHLSQAKLYQFQQICHGIASNSILIDALSSITSGKQFPISFKDFPISNSKLEMLAFYKEVSQYYQWRKKQSLIKEGKQGIEGILKNYPQLKECSLFQQQMHEKEKTISLLDRIGSKFIQLEQKLLGFALQQSGVNSLQDIQAKLAKLQDYVKQSLHPNSNDKATPKSVKEHNIIVNILTILGNSNVGLLQQALEGLQEPIKSICSRLVENITRNNKSVQAVYAFLLQRINESAAFRYTKSVRQLPLQKKLAECQRLMRQIRQNPQLGNKVSESASKQARLQVQMMIETLNGRIMDGDNRLILAEQQIYTLQSTNRTLQGQNVSLKARLKKVQEEGRLIYDHIANKNQQLTAQLQKIRLNQHSIYQQIAQMQHEIMAKDELIKELTNKLNESQTFLQQLRKPRNCMLQAKSVEYNIDPNLPSEGMEEVATLIQDTQLMDSNEPPSPIRHKRQRSTVKHSRSLSNVDFLSELLPEIIERDLQNESLSATADTQQLRRGIQLREKTIKKYEVYMQKQRKQAKRYRSQILELQAKIRALQMEKIKLQQQLQDQSSQKLLQMDGEGEQCGSLVQVEECEEVSSIEKIAEKEVELKVKEEEINFKIEEIIKHVLKLNTLKVTPHADSECPEEGTDVSPEATIL